MIIGFIIIPVSLNLCKEQIWEFVKEKIEKDAKYKKMVKDMLKGKKRDGEIRNRRCNKKNWLRNY